ncbi:Cupredoxin [Venustampulla echinocandica]|uniref:Cupredoxin n=1 Tax=Venustampulla echinocandica TaxID=2656787 RepID=A0A370TKT8_9HELO|nr:Cupredoxin [Venustampulla echinocandica]RDL36125.1 Cupredoxin [Venustampulla echinocandica]
MRFLQASLTVISVFTAGLVGVTSAVTHDEHFVPDAVLRVTEEERKQSCVPSKEILVVNGTSPGPSLRFTEGETVWIRVYNDIPHQNLTMHWHGLTMATAPFSDGTPQAAQWPIPPNHFFDYELHVPIGMAGTYFYHSHVGFQATSATGPLIIEEKDHPPYDYDGERIIFLQDVFPDTDEFIEEALLAVPMEYERAQEIVLINGKGGGRTDPGAPCNDSLSVINVEPGKTYRMRLIGGTGLSIDILGIEGHDNLEVIEADAAYTERHPTSIMQVSPGQRFSFLLHTHAHPDKQRYYIQLESREFGGVTRSFAVIDYGRPANDPTPEVYPPASPPITLPPTDPYWLEYSLRPYNNSEHPTASLAALDFPTAAEVTRRVNITSHLSIPQGGLVYKINGYTWNEGLVSEPYLVSLYKDGGSNWPSMERALQNDGLDPITYAFPALMGEVIEIVVQGTGSEGNGTETHPWHAHGAHYWDLGSGAGEYDAEANEARWRSSIGHPVKRDTTNLYKYSGKAQNGTLSAWRAWRLRIDHPGVWMIHCHLLPHMVWGMQTAWVMGNQSEVLGLIDRPGVEGYLTYGGSVAGNETNSPEVVEFFPLSDWQDGAVGDGTK